MIQRVALKHFKTFLLVAKTNSIVNLQVLVPVL